MIKNTVTHRQIKNGKCIRKCTFLSTYFDF